MSLPARMKVGMYYSNSDVRVEEQDVPAVGPGEILIKVLASGICGSDLLEWYRIKTAPRVLGHELTGEVVAVGDGVEGLVPGDRVFTTHHVPCEECPACLSGHETACTTFQTVNNFTPGGFAEYLKVGGRSVVTGTLKLPDGVSSEQGAFVEPLGTVVRGLRAAGFQPGQTILVVGTGLAGLLWVKAARAAGAGNVLATDLSDPRLRKAREFGAHHAVNARTDDLPAWVEQVNGGRKADVVVVCAGALPAAEAALRAVGKGGTVLFFAVPDPGDLVPVDFIPIWRDDVTIRTCYGASPRDNREALELLRTGAVQVDDMVTHRFGIDGIGTGFATAARPDDCLKVIIEPHG